MTTTIQRTILCLSLAAAFALPAWPQAAAKPPAKAEPAAKAEPTATAPIRYEPPRRGAPKGRIGGGTRGSDVREITLAVVAPDHAGLSSVASPPLYWFIAPASAAQFEVSVIEDGAAEALLDKAIPPPARAGVQRLDLESLGVRLAPGREYRWFVSVVSNPQARSSDVVASGKVIHEPLPAEVAARIAAASPAARPGLFAAAGFWYDAYHALQELRRASPDDAALRESEIALLSQAGLPQVAASLRAP